MKPTFLFLLSCLTAICQPYSWRDQAFGSSLPPTPDILWWRCNEGTGTAAYDSSVRGYAATINRAGQWTTGKAGDGISFSAANSDWLQSNSSINYATNRITVTFWVNLPAIPSVAQILLSGPYPSYNNNFFITDNSATQFYVSLHDNATGFLETYIARPSSGQWHHIAAVMDASTAVGSISLYLDGAPQTKTVAMSTLNFSGTFSTVQLNVGAQNKGAAFWTGTVDDIRIYSGLLTGAQIASVMRSPY